MARGRIVGIASETTSHTEDLLRSWLEQRPDLRLNDFLLGIAMMRIGRILDHWFGQLCLEEHGISAPDMRVLFALRRAGPPFVRYPTDLYRSLLVTSGAITKQIDRLSAKGFVKRTPDPSHGRKFLIRLTDKGKRVADQTTDVLAKHSLLTRAMATMPPARRKQGEKYILELLHAIEAVTKFGPELPDR
jgi:DNA-binding MarR family transcriptional regulator